MLAVHVMSGDGLVTVSPQLLDRQRALVESLGGSYHTLVGDDPAEAVLDFARQANATEIVIGATRPPPSRRCSAAAWAPPSSKAPATTSTSTSSPTPKRTRPTPAPPHPRSRRSARSSRADARAKAVGSLCGGLVVDHRPRGRRPNAAVVPALLTVLPLCPTGVWGSTTKHVHSARGQRGVGAAGAASSTVAGTHRVTEQAAREQADDRGRVQLLLDFRHMPWWGAS